MRKENPNCPLCYSQYMTAPVSELKGPVKALFTDLDGTLTSDGRVEAATYAALHKLTENGIPVVLVTGRPAGWGQAIASLWPVAAVVTENGGVSFIDGRKEYGVPPASLPDWKRRMRTAATEAMDEVPGARMSGDSKYREVDSAIDWNEESKLPLEDANKLVELLRARGFTATRSSVHVNFGPPKFDKLSACKHIVEKVFGGQADDLRDYVFIGDALNDAPMFAGFEKAVGVANVRKWWDDLESKPKFVCENAEGAGARELIEHLLTI